MIQKTPVTINFSKGIDTKSDPNQVQIGSFQALDNAIFDKGGLLEKRNGFSQLTALPDSTSNLVTTFNGNLTAIGSKLEAYSQSSETWINKGAIQIASVATIPLIRNSTNQSQVDSVVASNGLVCTVYTDNISSGSPVYNYVIADSVTGQNIVPPTAIPVATGAVAGSPRVFLLGNFFMIIFTNNISGTYHLQYVAINTTTFLTTSNVDISAQYTPASTVNFDGIVTNNSLYLAWSGNDGGGAIRTTYIDSGLTQHNTVVYSGNSAAFMSLTADNTLSTPVIYITWGDSSHNGYTIAVNPALVTVLAKTKVINSITIKNLTAVAQNGLLTVFYEVANNYGYSSGGVSDYIAYVTCTQAGVVGTPGVVVRSVGLASKAFIINGVIYMLSVYGTDLQPTYFLINSLGQVICKLAYSNGGGYLTAGLPGVSVVGTIVQIPYLFRDAVIPVNKTQGAANAGAVYAQTGINLASFNVTEKSVVTSEIGNDLHLSGGFVWMYDGYTPVEHSFHLYPDMEAAGIVPSTTGGSMSAQTYFYQVTYEWSDNQGNLHRSAPSIPLSVTTTGSISSVVINIPTLRLTYKTANPVKLVVYRWSTAQQTYYQVTSIASPVLNRTNIDYLTFTDTQADASIIGNSILYTTGGVVEDDAAPATNLMTLYKSRMIVVDAEDPNLLWYSKQVIEATPVEFSALFTIYVAPTISAQGNTGPITALSAMDDKLIIFKKDAIYYITGTGPDNTGANNDFSDPVFITSTVGCSNQQSIVFMPQGLMFQSDKGIWLLGRDLSTTYIGAPAAAYNTSVVQSGISVPGTNQVRFTLSSGVTLMYDYYYGQWGTFSGISAISSTLYASLHTYINQYGQVYQETPGEYLDGSNPVLMSFTTSWINVAGMMGYIRAYFFFFLAQYLSPHKLNVQIGYDYNPAPTQTVLIEPDNYNPPMGSDPIYGDGSPYGGASSQEEWRVFLNRQKCESFQVSVTEVFDSSFGVKAGAGFTMSGLNLVVGVKSGYARRSAARSAG